MVNAIPLHPQLVIKLQSARTHVLHQSEPELSDPILKLGEDGLDVLIGAAMQDQCFHLLFFTKTFRFNYLSLNKWDFLK